MAVLLIFQLLYTNKMDNRIVKTEMYNNNEIIFFQK